MVYLILYSSVLNSYYKFSNTLKLGFGGSGGGGGICIHGTGWSVIIPIGITFCTTSVTNVYVNNYDKMLLLIRVVESVIRIINFQAEMCQFTVEIHM